MIETKIEKWSRECLGAGFKFVKKLDGKNSLCECLKCGHQDSYRQSHVRNSNVVCSKCQTTKWADECMAQGFRFVEKVDKNYSRCECFVCGHVDEYAQNHMRAGRVACSKCRESKWTSECLNQGFKFLHKTDGNNSLCECLSCGHVDEYRQDAMRSGHVACTNCQITKWSDECLNQGFKFLHKTDKANSLAECLSCGHVDEYNQGAMRSGEVSCSNCSPGHWNEPSYFYVLKITHNNTIIKIGISNNPSQRYKQYGLIPDTETMELFTQQFETKLDAVQYESLIKRLIVDHQIPIEEAKQTLTKSGWTECFREQSLDTLVTILGKL